MFSALKFQDSLGKVKEKLHLWHCFEEAPSKTTPLDSFSRKTQHFRPAGGGEGG